MSAVPQISSDWQAGFLNVLRAVQSHARFRFRSLGAEQREDAVQEAIAAACVNYQQLAARGQLHVAHPGTLADFAVRHVRTGRHVGGRQNAARDVMSPLAHRRHGVNVARMDVKSCSDDTDGWREAAVANRRDSVADLAAFRIDFAEWLGTLTARDRKIIAAFVKGENTSFVAGRFGITAGRVSQLRRRYERAWQVFQGEVASRAGAA